MTARTKTSATPRKVALAEHLTRTQDAHDGAITRCYGAPTSSSTQFVEGCVALVKPEDACNLRLGHATPEQVLGQSCILGRERCAVFGLACPSNGRRDGASCTSWRSGSRHRYRIRIPPSPFVSSPSAGSG